MDKKLITITNRSWEPEDIHFWKNPKDGNDNASVIFNEKFSRLRAGIIVMKGNKILLGEESDERGEFSLPGGSINKGESIIDAAKRECQEEVGITCKNIEETGIDYCECHEEVKDWVKENVPEEEWWYNYYTCLCIGEYDKPYKGDINNVDLDPSMKKSSQFYNLEDVIDDKSFKYAWKLALYEYGYLDEEPKPSKEDIVEKIVKKGSKWQVQSEKGRNMGTYDNKADAKKRLQQIEYFKHLNEGYVTDKFELGKAGYIRDDGKLIILDEYHGEDDSLWPYQYPEFSNTHPEEDTCVRLWRKPTDAQYERLEEIINAYLDIEEYCKIEINNDFYRIFSLRENACDYKAFEEEVGNWTGYKLVQIIKNYFNNIKEELNESSRSNLISRAKSADRYKNGKENRWTRKSKCSVASTVKDYNKIDMNTFWKEDTLNFGVRVKGETGEYTVSISFKDILPKIERKIKDNKNLLQIRCIYDALIQAINNGDVLISCDCPDYTYRLKYWNSKNGDEAKEKETRASDITNPDNTKGPACKHILAVLNNVDWLKKIASVINNYINYCKDNMGSNYAKFIFPKLYGMPYTKAVQLTLDDYDENGELKDNLDSSEEIINLANALGRVRGRFTKGSNKNPASKKNDEKEE